MSSHFTVCRIVLSDVVYLRLSPMPKFVALEHIFIVAAVHTATEDSE